MNDHRSKEQRTSEHHQRKEEVVTKSLVGIAIASIVHLPNTKGKNPAPPIPPDLCKLVVVYPYRGALRRFDTSWRQERGRRQSVFST